MRSNKIVLVFCLLFLTINLYAKDLRSIKVEYINFNNITLNNLFGFLSKEYGINFSIEPEYRQNTISIHLQNSNLKSLLDIITRDNGMVYKRKGDIIYITPFKQNLEKRYLTGDYKKKRIVLNYASLTDTIKFLQDMMPGQALIRSTTTNQPYSNLFNADPELKVPELKSEDEESSGNGIIPKIETESATSDSGSQADSTEEGSSVEIDKNVPTDVIYIIPFFNTNSVYLLSTNNTLIKEAEELIKDIDQPLKQVLIQGEIIQLALGDEFNSVFNLDLSNALLAATDTFSLGGASGTKNIKFNYFNKKIKANIEIAKTDNRASTIASPMLLAMNRVTSTLDLTYEVPMIAGYTSGEIIQVEGGGALQKEPSPIYAVKKVGTVLKITPFINSRDEILLKVDITTSEIATGGGKMTVQDAAGNLVDKDIDTVIESIVQTTLSTLNGEAIIIGGLIQKRKTAKNVKVPLLGDIPILGIPFNDIEEVDSKDEQVIILKPIIIDSVDPKADLVKKSLYKEIKSPKTLEEEIEDLRRKEQEKVRTRDIDKVVPAIAKAIKETNEDLKQKWEEQNKVKKDTTEVKYDETIEEFLEE